MIKILLFSILLLIWSCSDQGEFVKYSFVNNSALNLKVVLYDRFGDIDTTYLNQSENKVLDKEPPPYDSGPFFSMDSIALIFFDNKKIIYRRLKSKSDCLGSEKNPYCQYSHFLCSDNTCKFIIDNNEYIKAR